MMSRRHKSTPHHSRFRSWRRRPYLYLFIFLVSVVLIMMSLTNFLDIDSGWALGLVQRRRIVQPLPPVLPVQVQSVQVGNEEPEKPKKTDTMSITTTTTTATAKPDAAAETSTKTRKPKRLCSSAIGTKDAKNVSHLVGNFQFGHKFEPTPGWDASIEYDWNSQQRQITLPPTELLPEDCITPAPQDLVGEFSLDEYINVDRELDDINGLHPEVDEGGSWSPFTHGSLEADLCPKVAVVIPYRNRWTHLKIALHFLHTLLQRQKINYRIFVAEQFGENTFSRGVISNAAFVSLMGIGVFDCIIFQDVDLIPENDHNIYNCKKSAQHFAVAMDKFKYNMPYDRYFGGVLGLSSEHFIRINGYPNTYWGWGGEDDDLYFRTEAVGLNVTRLPLNIAHYKMLDHKNEKRLPNKYTCDLLRTARTRFLLDGLSTLRFRLLKIDYEHLYTRLLIDVGLPDRVHYPEN